MPYPLRLIVALIAIVTFSTAPVLAQTASPPPAAVPETSDGQNGAGAPQNPANPDKDFAAMMTTHHQAAIALAQSELKYGKDSTMRRLATGIVTAQKKEIDEIRHWQAKHPAQ